MIKLENKTVVDTKWKSREYLVTYMKENGIKVKCISKAIMLKKGGIAEPGLDIRFVTAGSTASIFKDKTKESAKEILGLRTEEDCERVNRELES